MRLRLLISEAVRSIVASMSTTVAATVTVLIGMFVLGLAIALGTWVLSWSDHVKSEILVKVFFLEDATPKQIQNVRLKLAGNGEVKSFTFISREQALVRMRKQYPKLVQNLPSNPLPASFEILPKKGEYAADIRRSLAPPPPGVANVKDGGDTAKKILRVGKIVELVFIITVFVLLSASMVLIANTIRLSIFARRREIEVMKLVGATNWFVRGPFMVEGLLCGLAGSVAAVVLLLLGKEIALPAILGHIDQSKDAKALAFELNALILVSAGLLLGVTGSGLTLRRFLKV